ncbi:MAG: hypothetical protein QOH48_1420 [Actinomycetota bacterium]|jgi:hypothetical protein|nr:hypothetical protein [Actinomycetota bacterium]
MTSPAPKATAGEVRFRADLPLVAIEARVQCCTASVRQREGQTDHHQHRSDDVPAEDLLNLLGFRETYRLSEAGCLSVAARREVSNLCVRHTRDWMVGPPSTGGGPTAPAGGWLLAEPALPRPA